MTKGKDLPGQPSLLSYERGRPTMCGKCGHTWPTYQEAMRARGPTGKIPCPQCGSTTAGLVVKGLAKP